MTTYRIEGEQLTTAEIAARCPGINRHTIASRLLRGYRTWAELRASKAETLRKSKQRFKSWNIQPKNQIPA